MLHNQYEGPRTLLSYMAQIYTLLQKCMVLNKQFLILLINYLIHPPALI